MNHQSQRMLAVSNPVIPGVAALIRDNPGTISLGQGVVHYKPPQEVFDEVTRFGNEVSHHHYQSATGLPALREMLQDKLARENDIVLCEDQALVVTAGSNLGFYHAIMCVCDPGDEVILMSPYFFNHEMAVCMANCQPVLVPTDSNYQLQLDDIRDCIGERTRAIVTVSPNNPAGVVYPPEAIAAVNQLCVEHDLYHFCDEAYEYFTYEGARHYSAGSATDNHQHTVSMFSFSKSFALASWRIGYMVWPRPLLRAFEKSQDTLLICPPVVSQYAAIGALKAGSAYLEDRIETLGQVRRMCLERMEELGSSCFVPEANGAFYLLARLDCGLGSMQVVERLITEFKVAVLPGTGFGLEEDCRIRIAYGALEPHTVAEGTDRLVKGLKSIIQ